MRGVHRADAEGFLGHGRSRHSGGGFRARSGPQDCVTVVVVGPVGDREDFNYGVSQAHYLAVGVEAVALADGATPGYVVQAIAETVGVLVIVGHLEAFRGDIHVIVSGTQVPGQSDVVVAISEVAQNFLALGVGRVQLCDDRLQASGGFAGDLQSGGAHRDYFRVERAFITQLPSLLDDGAAGKFGLGSDVDGVGIGVEYFSQLAPEVGNVGSVPFLSNDLASPASRIVLPSCGVRLRHSR